MKKFLTLVALLVAVACVGWYVLSPWWAMKGLRDAAVEVDVAALEERIDFPAVRESVKSQLRDGFAERAARPETTSVLEQLGTSLTLAAADRVIDAMVTPRGMAAMIVTGSIAAPLVPEEIRGREAQWSVEREGLDSFRAVPTLDDGREGPNLVFARDGLGWDVVAVELPD